MVSLYTYIKAIYIYKSIHSAARQDKRVTEANASSWRTPRNKISMQLLMKCYARRSVYYQVKSHSTSAHFQCQIGRKTNDDVVNYLLKFISKMKAANVLYVMYRGGHWNRDIGKLQMLYARKM